MEEKKDLYVIVRADLSPGQVAVQGIHAYQRFHSAYPDIVEKWVKESNHLSFLAVKTEEQLKFLEQRIIKADRKYAVFKEPDLNFSLTGICLEPGNESKKIVRKLSYALKDAMSIQNTEEVIEET